MLPYVIAVIVEYRNCYHYIKKQTGVRSLMQTSEATAVRSNEIGGFADYSRPEHVEFGKWKKVVGEAFEQYGFTRFESRRVERATQLTKKGEGGLDRELWAIGHYSGGAIENNNEAVLCLPFDRTVPLAIWISKNPNTILPFKRQDIDYSWRVETPMPGRFRSFIQADIDIIDRKLSTSAEAECVQAGLEALKRIDIKDYTVYFNHIAVAKKLIATLQLPEDKADAAFRVVDKIDKITPEGVTKELIELCGKEQEQQINGLVELFAFKGSVGQFKDKFSSNKFITLEIQKFVDEVYLLVQLLEAQGADSSKLCFSPGMVRGLDYYTGIVLETFLNKAPHRGSIFSGGRYDNLVSAVSDNKDASINQIQGFGASIGLTRLFDVCLRENLVKPVACTSAKVLICYRKTSSNTTELQIVGAQLAGRIRKLNISVDFFTNPDANVKKQLAYANTLGFPNVILVMEKDTFVIKEMKDENQWEVKSMDKAIEVFEENLKIQAAKKALTNYPEPSNPSGKVLNAPKASLAKDGS